MTSEARQPRQRELIDVPEGYAEHNLLYLGGRLRSLACPVKLSSWRQTGRPLADAERTLAHARRRSLVGPACVKTHCDRLN